MGGDIGVENVDKELEGLLDEPVTIMPVMDYEEKRDYTHDLSDLCPNAPDTQAVECEK